MSLDVLTDPILAWLNQELLKAVEANQAIFNENQLNLDTNDPKVCFVKTKGKPKQPNYASSYIIALCKGKKDIAEKLSKALCESLNSSTDQPESIKSIESSKFGHLNVYLTPEAMVEQTPAKKGKQPQPDKSKSKFDY